MPSASAVELKDVLRRHVVEDCRSYYGLSEASWIERAVENWSDYRRNYDGRWRVITDQLDHVGRILDMAAGVGTFLLYTLRLGVDAWGVEPEPWKREYFAQQLRLSGSPDHYGERLVAAIGESLPFDDESFDLVTSYQTLEHVDDPSRCIHEMLRVLRPGGTLYLKAPDYRCFFEPHYRLPFLPCMNRRLAAAYLRRLHRPLRGLDSLNWTTEGTVMQAVRSSEYDVRIERLPAPWFTEREEKIRERLPAALRRSPIVRGLNHAYECRYRLPRLARVLLARQERNINLWIVKQNRRIDVAGSRPAAMRIVA